MLEIVCNQFIDNAPKAPKRAFTSKITKQAEAGNSMRRLRDIRRGVTDGWTDGQTLL